MNLRLLRTYYLLEEKIQHQGIVSPRFSPAATIPPEDQAQIQQYIETIAAILIRTNSLEYLRTSKDIELALHRQTQITEFSMLIIHLLKQHISRQRLFSTSTSPAVPAFQPLVS